MKTAISSNPSGERRETKPGKRAEGGFTMVEIALSLAIIGFALVAIIGILPAGMSVQKDNLEQTIINLDGAYLMNAIKSGARGQQDLPNYIIAIYMTNTTVVSSGNWPTRGGGGYPPGYVNQAINNYTNGNPILASASNIIGLMSIPKYAPAPGMPGTVQGYWNNSVVAEFRAINAPATDQGLSRANQDFSFKYLVTVEVIPTGESPYQYTDSGQTNLTAPIYTTNTPFASQALAEALQDNLFEIRLTFRWPVLPNGGVGNKKQVFRSSVAASYPHIYEPNNFSVPGQWLLQPQIYSATGVP